MRQFDRLRATILALFPDLISYSHKTKATETERRLSSAYQQLEQARLAVVVCGEFKRGKSSLLNALLEEPGLFPVDDYYATSLVSTISYADTEQVTVLLSPKEGASETRQISRAEMAGYVTESGNRDNRKGVDLVTIATPNPRLASGLTFVDTPGVGGVYVRHTMATLAFLPLAHAVLFVADATQVLTESELHFLRRAAASAKVTDDADGLVCVLTKIDLVSDYDRLLANTRAKLAETLSRPADQVLVIPVSAKAKLRYMARGDERYLRLSNFPELERVIWATLSRRQAKVLLGGALTELERSTQALLQPIDSELAALRADTKEHEEQLRAAQQKRKIRLIEMEERGPRWRRELEAQLADTERAVRHTAESQLDGVWQQFRSEYLHRNDFLRDPDRLVSRLNEDAVAVMGVASKLLSQRATRLQREFSEKVGFDLGNTRVQDLPDPPVSQIYITDRLMDDAPGGSAGPARTGVGLATAGGAAVGAALGTMVLPGIGTVVGAIAGGLVGMFTRRRIQAVAAPPPPTAPRQDVQALRRTLEAQISPMEKVQRRHLDDAVRAVADEFGRAVLAELDSCVIQEQQSIEDSVRRAEQATKRSAEAARARETELTAERAPIDAVREAIATLADEVRLLSSADEAGSAAETGEGQASAAG